MKVVKVIQPHEFGDNFILEEGKWKVKFPPTVTSGVEVSKDANNLITLGGDGGMFADATRLHAYALVQDTENMKIHLYRHQEGLEFDVGQATLISSIDMLELNGQFDDITITDAVVTFKDVQTDTELVFDTDQFQDVTGLEMSHPLVKNSSDSVNYVEMEVTLHRGESGGGISVSFEQGGAGYSSGTYWGYSITGQSLAELLNYFANGLQGIEFYDVEEIVLTDDPFKLQTTIGVRNLNSTPVKMSLWVSDMDTIEDSPTGVEFTGGARVRRDNESQWSLTLGGVANGISVKVPTSEVNLIKSTPDGLLLLPPSMFDIDHSLEASSYQVDVSDDVVEINEFVRTINGNKLRIPAVTLKNSRGKTLAAIVAPISEKLPIPTTDRITIDTNTSILDSRVLINGVDKGSFVDLSLNQIPELQFTLVSVSSYSGGDGYVDGSYEVDPYNESSYSGDGYTDSYGSYGGDGYTIETEGYQFIVRNNTEKRLRVTIDGFNAINLTARSNGINSLAIGSNEIGFDLAPRFVDEVSMYFAFCNEDGVALSMAERDVLHEGGSSVNLMATYLNYSIDAPVINVNVNGNNQIIYAGNSTLFNVTLPSIDDYLNLYYRPEIVVTAVKGSPINAPIYIDAIAVMSVNPMPRMTVISGGLSIPYACEESAWNNKLNYVYRPVEGNDKAIVSSGREFSIDLHPRFANMDVVYDSDDVPLGQQQIGKLDNSGSIKFTIKQLISRTDSDAIIGIRDNSIDNFHINITVNRM